MRQRRQWTARPSARDGEPRVPGEPAWFKESFLDIREDIAEATTTGRRVLLYFYQDGCPYCAKLLNDNFGNREIAEKTQQGFDVITHQHVG